MLELVNLLLDRDFGRLFIVHCPSKQLYLEFDAFLVTSFIKIPSTDRHNGK
jgi:hypothetical protein